MRVWIDNDGCPQRVREVIFKASARLGFKIFVVANRGFVKPPGLNLESIVVSSAFDAADHYIAENVLKGDVVITADVPLAARVIENEACALSPHGRLFNKESIGEQLALRNLSHELRSAGEIRGGKGPLATDDIKKFAAAFDRLIAKFPNENKK